MKNKENEKLYYCSNCNELIPEEDTEIVERIEQLFVRDQLISLKVKTRICKECGEPLLDFELDDASLQQFYNEYRKKNNLLFPNEIKKIREKCEMSQHDFANFLGIDEKTIASYENESIPTKIDNALIKMVSNKKIIENVKILRLLKDNLYEDESADEIILGGTEETNEIIKKWLSR